MDRRGFLKISSMTALMAAGEWTGLSKIFARSSSQNSFSSVRQSSGNMEHRNLGQLNVSAVGLGCLPMVGYYGGRYEKRDMIALIRRAYEKGITFSIRPKFMDPMSVRSGSERLWSHSATR